MPTQSLSLRIFITSSLSLSFSLSHTHTHIHIHMYSTYTIHTHINICIYQTRYVHACLDCMPCYKYTDICSLQWIWRRIIQNNFAFNFNHILSQAETSVLKVFKGYVRNDMSPERCWFQVNFETLCY